MNPQYFTSRRGRHGGKQIIQFHQLRHDGSIKTVDPERKTIRVNQSFGSKPRSIQTSTKEDFTNAINELLDIKKNQ